MSFTKQEIKVMQDAIYYHPFRWVSPEGELCPFGALAKLRGFKMGTHAPITDGHGEQAALDKLREEAATELGFHTWASMTQAWRLSRKRITRAISGLRVDW